MADSPLEELVTEQLRDLYDAEKQLTRALPRLAKAASDEELAQGFRDHLEQTNGHVQRLEQIFEALGMKAKSKPCEAMKGLVQEGKEAIEEDIEDPVYDLGLIAAGRRVEHYEMAAYDTLVAAFQSMKKPEITSLLQQTLREENETDKRLTTVAKRLLKEAGRGPSADSEGGSKGKSGSQAGSRSSSGKSSSSSSSGKNASSKSSSGRSAGSSSSKGSSKGKGSGSRSGSSGSDEGHLSKTTSDHDEIREWAETRGGKPACVQGTGGKGDIGLLRIEFPGKPGANDSKLHEISWDEFFEKFDERGLALVYQEETADGQQSNFNKLISAEAPAKSKSKSAR
jgi:ferritin-like metal-binding protein YciE